MTTSPRPWALSALSACAVVDASGKHIALFDDWRDAQLVVEMMKEGVTPELVESLWDELATLREGLEEEREESANLEEENRRLEGRVKELTREPVPQPRFTSPLPWVADWKHVCLFPAYQPNHPRDDRVPLAKFLSVSDLDYVVRLLERAKP